MTAPATTWVRLFVRFAKRKPWEEVMNGPFPVTADQVAEARRRYAAERAAAGDDPFAGCRTSALTTARDILRDVAPQLSAFDSGMIAYAVAAEFWKAVSDPPAPA